MKHYRYVAGLLMLLTASRTSAQTVQVSAQNRTIELSTESSIEVQADLVSITVGYENYGPTHEVAYNENVRAASQILKAWAGAGIPENQISTQSLSLVHVPGNDLKEVPIAERKQKQYEATQSWTIVAKPEIAQRLLDIAVNAGANNIGEPEWKLSDPDAAEAKAYASALGKARSVAEQMAKSFGTSVGALLYASNQGRTLPFLSTVNTTTSGLEVRGVPPPPPHPVKLLPQKIEKKALVRAIFALL
jgi:uncharacterized protein YggE